MQKIEQDEWSNKMSENLKQHYFLDGGSTTNKGFVIIRFLLYRIFERMHETWNIDKKLII